MNSDFVTAILLLGVLIGIIGALITKLVIYIRPRVQERKEESEKKSYLEIVNEGYEDWVEEAEAKGETYSIAGINFHGPDDSWIGKFDGVLEAEPWNTHDKNAIAIYRIERVKVGYIPRDLTFMLHDELKENHGELPCVGYVHAFLNESHLKRYSGTILIKEKP